MIQFNSAVDYDAIYKSWKIDLDYCAKTNIYCRRCKGTGDLHTTHPKPYAILMPCISCKTLSINTTSALKLWRIESTIENLTTYYWRMKAVIDYNYNLAVKLRPDYNLPPLDYKLYEIV